MVEQGAVWVYRRYARGSSFAVLYKAEARAKKNRLGLWRLKNLLEPWKYRRFKKRNKITVISYSIAGHHQ
jgi:endonuclease YncB( thermonuclease family)